MLWYYKPRVGRTQGSTCWYCGRTWYSTFRVKFPTLGMFLKECAKDLDGTVPTKACKMAMWLLQECVKAGTHNIQISFSDCPASVSSTNRQGVLVEDEDLHIELEFYKTKWEGGKGDPLTNGLGHKTGWFEGTYGVFIPGAPIRKIKRQKHQFVVHKGSRRWHHAVVPAPDGADRI